MSCQLFKDLCQCPEKLAKRVHLLLSDKLIEQILRTYKEEVQMFFQIDDIQMDTFIYNARGQQRIETKNSSQRLQWRQC